MNFSTQIGVRTVTTAVLACSAASLLAVAPVTHPPQENPMTIDATAPIAIPCRRRVRDSPWRIDGDRIALAFRSEGRRDVHPTARRKSWLNEGHRAHRWRRRCQERERKSRYFLVSTADLGQACRLPAGPDQGVLARVPLPDPGADPQPSAVCRRESAAAKPPSDLT